MAVGIYDELSKDQFIEYFAKSDNYKSNFSYENLGFIYELLWDESEFNEPDQVTVIDLVCIAGRFSEFKDIKSLYYNYCNQLHDFVVKEFFNNNESSFDKELLNGIDPFEFFEKSQNSDIEFIKNIDYEGNILVECF